MNLEVPIEMVDRGLGSTTSGPIIFLRSQTYLDPSNYDGATYYFEIVGYNSNASGTYAVDLYDVTDSDVKTSITIPNSTTNETRLRSASWSPDAANHIYAVRTPDIPTGSGTVRVYTARIIVVQVNATKTRIQIPMLGTSGYSNSDDEAYVDAHSSDSYTQGTTGYYTRFLKTASNFATISGWSLTVVGEGGSDDFYATLWNVTDNAQIAASEVIILGLTSTPTIANTDFANNATNFDDGDEFEVYIKIDNPAGNVKLYKADLYVTLTTLTKTEIYWRASTYSGATAAAANTGIRSRVLMTTSNYSNPAVYHDFTGLCADDDDIFFLKDDSTNDSGTGGAAEPDSEINVNSASKDRVRSVALTLDDGDRYWGYKVASTDANAYITSCMILIYSYETPAPTAAGQVIFVNEDW